MHKIIIIREWIYRMSQKSYPDYKYYCSQTIIIRSMFIWVKNTLIISFIRPQSISTYVSWETRRMSKCIPIPNKCSLTYLQLQYVPQYVFFDPSHQFFNISHWFGKDRILDVSPGEKIKRNNIWWVRRPRWCFIPLNLLIRECFVKEIKYWGTLVWGFPYCLKIFHDSNSSDCGVMNCCHKTC